MTYPTWIFALKLWIIVLDDLQKNRRIMWYCCAGYLKYLIISYHSDKPGPQIHPPKISGTRPWPLDTFEVHNIKDSERSYLLFALLYSCLTWIEQVMGFYFPRHKSVLVVFYFLALDSCCNYSLFFSVGKFFQSIVWSFLMTDELLISLVDEFFSLMHLKNNFAFLYASCTFILRKNQTLKKKNSFSNDFEAIVYYSYNSP